MPAPALTAGAGVPCYCGGTRRTGTVTGRLDVCSGAGPKLRLFTALVTVACRLDRDPGQLTETPVTVPPGVMEKLMLIVPPAVGSFRRRLS